MTGLSRGQWAARAVISTMPAAAALCTSGAGEGAPLWFLLVVLLLSLGWAAFPDSAAGATVLVLVLVWWGVGLRDGINPWALPAAAALLAAHVAAVLASYGPPEMPLDRDVVALWVRRAAWLYTATPATYALASWVRDVPAPDGVWVGGLLAACCATAAASVTLTVHEDGAG